MALSAQDIALIERTAELSAERAADKSVEKMVAIVEHRFTIHNNNCAGREMGKTLQDQTKEHMKGLWLKVGLPSGLGGGGVAGFLVWLIMEYYKHKAQAGSP